jgi:hypothetical protein
VPKSAYTCSCSYCSSACSCPTAAPLLLHLLLHLLLLLQVKLVLERGTGSLPPGYFQGREGIATWEVGAPTRHMAKTLFSFSNLHREKKPVVHSFYIKL